MYFWKGCNNCVSGHSCVITDHLVQWPKVVLYSVVILWLEIDSKPSICPSWAVFKAHNLRHGCCRFDLWQLKTHVSLQWISAWRQALFVSGAFNCVCLSVTVKWLAVKTASEMTCTVSVGALNSAQSNPFHLAHSGWLGVTVRASEFRPSGSGFDSQSRCCQVTNHHMPVSPSQVSAAVCGWEDNRRFGVASTMHHTMHHTLSGLSTYELSGLEREMSTRPGKSSVRFHLYFMWHKGMLFRNVRAIELLSQRGVWLLP